MNKMFEIACVFLAGLLLVPGPAIRAEEPGAKSETAAPAKEQVRQIHVRMWGSSSSRMLRHMMRRVIPDSELMLRGGGSRYLCQTLLKMINEGKEDEYKAFMEKLKQEAQFKKCDILMFQVLGSIVHRKGAPEHIARILDDTCQALKYDGGPEVVIFEHWTSKHRDMLRGWVVEAAKRNGVRVAFCGSALNAVFDDKGGDEAANKYVGSRNIHAHPRGLYIATCAMYAALTGRSPVGLPAPTPKKKPDTRPGKQDPNYTEEELRYLQTIAWETQKKYAKTLPAPRKTLVENQARPVLKTEKKDVPAAYSDPEYFESAIEMFEADDKKNPQPEGAVVCVGSSSIVGWHNTIQKDLAPLKIIPRGFGGSTMNCALHYVDRVVIKYKPSAILLYEGDNDIDGGVEPEYFVKTFKKFAAKIHKALPETRIFALSIKPSPSRWDRWPDMKKANELLKAECGRNSLLTYIDIATPMLGRDGTPKREIFTDDELHMNRKGYELWTKTIKPVLLKALPAKR